MDDIDTILTRVVTKVSQSSLPDTEKADVFARLNVGMRSLIWPILLSHMPKDTLEHAVNDTENITMEQYVTLIQSALAYPATAKEIHTEIYEALTEVEQLVDTYITKHPTSSLPLTTSG